jgi:hypothetical protein
MGALGERFVLYRLDVDDPNAQAKRSLRHRGQETLMRDELSAAVAAVLDTVDTTAPPRDLDDAEVDWLVNLAVFVVAARTAVERDGYDREVVVMPALEAPGRLVHCLGAVLAGLEAIGADQETCWRITTKVAWDCVPGMRRRILEALHDKGPLRRADVMTVTDIPQTSCERTLEDLALLKLVDRTKSSAADNARWTHTLSPTCASTWPNSSPESSGDRVS